MSAPSGLDRAALLGAGVVALCAVVLRVGWVVWRYDAGGEPLIEFPDEADYWAMGSALARGQTMADTMGFVATRMPGYPGFIAAVLALGGDHFAVRLAQAVLGGLACALIALAAVRIAGDVHGLAAGALAACDPFFVFFSGLLLTETLWLSALSVVAWTIAVIIGPSSRRSATADIALGLALAAAVYVHPTAGVYAIGWCALRAISPRKGRLRGVLAMVACLAVLIAPWAVRNYLRLGTPVVLTTRGGISLYDGVRPGADGSSNLGPVRDLPAVRGLGEVEWDRYFRTRSWAAIRDDPMRIARLAGVKFQRTWSLWPHAAGYRTRGLRAVSALWTVIVLVLGLVGAIALARRAPGALAWLLWPVAASTLLHMLLVGSVRYRLGPMLFLEVLAGIGLAYAVRAWRSGGQAASRASEPRLS